MTDPNQPATMRTAEYARLLGVTPRTLTYWWQSGQDGVVRPINAAATRAFLFPRHKVMAQLAGGRHEPGR